MTLYIHASSLSSYADCPRRTAARALKEEIQEVGYALRITPQTIGAIVGTAMHAGIAHTLLEKINTGVVGKIKDAEERSISVLREESEKEEVLLDSITSDFNEAEQQTLNVLRSAYEHAIPSIKPKEIERRLEAHISEDTILTGQIDVIKEDGIIDWKSGTKRRVNGPQYGAYLLLGRTYGLNVEDATEYYIPRTRSDKSQSIPEIYHYSGAVVENQAMSIAKHFERDVTEFLDTQNRFAFMANPNSMLCSSKYCPAWGTNFCKEHKQ